MKKRKLSYFWIIPISLIFPIIQNILFVVRFEQLTVEVAFSSLIFIPVGLSSGWFLIYILRKDIDYKRKRRVAIAYIISIPFAIFLSTMSSLLVPPYIGITIFGIAPMVIGILLGYNTGSKVKTSLIIFSIIWAIVLYPAINIGYVIEWNMNALPTMRLLKTLVRLVPISIGTSLITSWIMYAKKKQQIAEIFILLPINNFLLLLFSIMLVKG